MFRPLRPSEHTFVFTVMDASSAVVGVTLALFTWSLTAGMDFSWRFIAERMSWYLAAPLWTVVLSPTRHAGSVLDLSALLRGLGQGGAALLVAYLAAFFSVGPEVLPRLVALYILWNCTWLTLGGRLALLWLLTRDPFTRRVLIIGDGPAADAARGLIHASPGVHVIRLTDESEPCEPEPVYTLAMRLKASEIVVTGSAHASAAVALELLRCQELGATVTTFEQLYEQTLRRVPVRHVSPRWLLVELLGGNGPRDASPFAKRTLDVLAAFGLLAVLAPLAAVAAVAIYLESGGPVLYSQVRLGRAGRPFRLFKLRTMTLDAEVKGPQWSGEGDVRVTRVGRWLRRTHLDELPNVWAVLRGDMSMVGPRPERPEFVAHLERDIPWYRARLTVAPGLTGWAQVNHEYGDSVEDAVLKLEYDLYYIRHQSLWFDLAVLLRTVGRVLGFRGR